MKYKYQRLVTAFVFFFSLIFFSTSLNAAVENKEEAQMKAFADAGVTPEAVVLKEEAAEAAKDTGRERMFYPQRLEKVVSVEEEPAQKVESYYHFMPTSDASSQSGKLTVQEAAFEYSYELKAFDKIPIEFGVGADYINISNSTVVKVPAKLTELGFGVNTTLPVPFVDKTYFRIGVTPQFASDNWNLRSNSFRIPINSLLIYQPDDKLTWILGVVVTPTGKDKVIPYGGFIYNPGNKWLFEIVPPRPVITYSLNNKVDLFGEFNIASSDYKVTKDGYRGAELEYRDMHAGFGAVYKFNKYIQASLAAGGVFNRRLQYTDSLGKINIKNGAYTELRVEMGI